MQRVKPTMSNKLQLERKRVAGKLYGMPASVRKATKWMDEASWVCNKHSGRVWGDKTKGEIVVPDKGAPRTVNEQQWLHFGVTLNTPWALTQFSS